MIYHIPGVYILACENMFVDTSFFYTKTYFTGKLHTVTS